MAVRRQDDQHEHTFSSYVRIRDVVLKTCHGWWMIGRSGERGSGISVLPARHDDDDEIKLKVCWKTDVTVFSCTKRWYQFDRKYSPIFITRKIYAYKVVFFIFSFFVCFFFFFFFLVLNQLDIFCECKTSVCECVTMWEEKCRRLQPKFSSSSEDCNGSTNKSMSTIFLFNLE